MTTLYLARKFCHHGQHEWPADDFMVLPGIKVRREVCSRCHAKILAERERVKQSQRAQGVA